MDTGRDSEIALLSIQPKYIDAIISGEKKVEFRRQKFGKSVDHIVIYGTKPIQGIVAYFRVSHITQASPYQLWKKYHDIGGIEKKAFKRYFNGAKKAVAIGIESLTVLPEPISLGKICDTLYPPQSFTYLSESIFDKLQELV